MPAPQNAPEQRTIDVDVESIDTRGRTAHGYAAMYGVLSDDLGGYKERIAPGAFAQVLPTADVRALLNHDANEVLGRTKSGTLRLFDEDRGLRFELDLPDSPLGENVREAVKRGDIDGASFRFQIDQESWDGEVRTVESVKALKDITLATYPAYPEASVELRTRPDSRPDSRPAVPADDAPISTPGLQIEDRTTRPDPRGLADEFRAAGFPGETATLEWQAYEDRAITWTGSVDNVSKHRSTAGKLGYDQRWVWPVVPREGVDASVTSVDVFTQSARALATAANVVRAIDAVTNKPETGSTLTIVTTPLHQVANVQSGIPNIYLEQAAFNTVIESDLRLALSDGLDKLVLDKFVASGFQTPLANMILSVRAAMTTLMAAGYAPDTLVLTPAAAEALDVLVSGIAGGTADFVFAPGQFAPNIWDLNRRISKTVPAPVVLDSTAFGRLYAGPVSLARFEEAAGKTNTSLVRLETTGVFGVERQNAAIRIAAS
jgi:uncharacterized protein